MPQSLPRWLVIGALLFVSLGVLQTCSGKKRNLNAATVAELPVQTAVLRAPSQLDGYEIEPVAQYEIRAKVLAIERYRFGREADLSPVDFVLGWGPMSNNAVVEQLSFSQSNRWYFYQWSGEAPADPNVMANSSANTHMVPLDKALKKRLLSVKTGEIVKLKGHLINVKHSDGWTWTSSISREDRGKGACELFLVEDISVE